MTANRCETCRFWYSDTKEPYDEDVMAECRRFPPSGGHYAEYTDSLRESRPFMTRFPLTMSHDWCGEWQAKKSTAVQ